MTTDAGHAKRGGGSERGMVASPRAILARASVPPSAPRAQAQWCLGILSYEHTIKQDRGPEARMRAAARVREREWARARATKPIPRGMTRARARAIARAQAPKAS
eukprot:683187-Pyramimonas_sp.AAC.1